MLSQAQFERYQLSRHLKEWRESEWDKTARFLLTARLWQEAVKNIGEYWFGIPSVPRMADDLPMLPLTNEGIRECLL